MRAILMPKPAFILPILLIALWITSCQVQKRGSSFGADFFRRDFVCSAAPPRHETSARYRAAYAEVRRRFALDSKTRRNADIVLTGDSTAMLFTDELLKRELPDLNIVNRGIGGDTTRLLLGRVEDVTVLKPRAVIVAIGGNDLLGGRCISEILGNTEKIIAKLQASSPALRVVLVSIPPVLTWKANSISPYYNYRLRRLTLRQSRVSYLDLWSELSDVDYPQLKAEFHRVNPGGKKKPDVIHFNEAGYAAWARLIRKSLAEP